MSEHSRERESRRERRKFLSYWNDPKRRLYLCLAIYFVCGCLVKVSKFFVLGVFGAVLALAVLTFRAGNFYWYDWKGQGFVCLKGDPRYTLALVLIFFIVLAMLVATVAGISEGRWEK